MATPSSSGSASGETSLLPNGFCARRLSHGQPGRIVIDGSHTDRVAIVACDMTDRLRHGSRRKKSIRIRQCRYLNYRIEQDHRAIKRRMRPRFGFQTVGSARAILGAIEMIHMMRKQQAKYARNQRLSLADQFERLAV
jgi:putative transposase